MLIRPGSSMDHPFQGISCLIFTPIKRLWGNDLHGGKDSESEEGRLKGGILEGDFRVKHISSHRWRGWSKFKAAEIVQFSLSVMSDSLRPHGLQDARPPCLSPAPGVYSNSCPLSRWCHPNISSSVDLFSSCPLPQHESFPMRWLFTSGGQSIGVSASASVLPTKIQDYFLQDGLVGSLYSPKNSQESSPTPQF